MSIFSDKLKSMVASCGVPVASLAEYAGLSPSMLYIIQSGSRLPEDLTTVERLIEAMACSLVEREDLIQTYKIERIGSKRYASFRQLLDMLKELTKHEDVQPRQGTLQDYLSIPSVIHDKFQINAAIKSMLDQEVQRERGYISMLMPLMENDYFELLSSALSACNPEFDVVRHLFCLTSSFTDEAVLSNMEAIHRFMPRMLTLPHYDPWYSYLPDPNDRATPFPYILQTSDGVLQISGDMQHALFTNHPEACNLFSVQFEHILSQFRPVMFHEELEFRQILWMHSRIEKHEGTKTRPVIMSSAPSIISCLNPTEVLAFLRSKVFLVEDECAIIERYFQVSSQRGMTSFFTFDGLIHLIETGFLPEVQCRDIPQLPQEKVLDALEELVRRARSGLVTLHLFRRDVLNGYFPLCLALYGSKLFALCTLSDQKSVFSDITEATLSRVLKAYADDTLTLGDVEPSEQSADIIERVVKHYRTQMIQ